MAQEQKDLDNLKSIMAFMAKWKESNRFRHLYAHFPRRLALQSHLRNYLQKVDWVDYQIGNFLQSLMALLHHRQLKFSKVRKDKQHFSQRETHKNDFYIIFLRYLHNNLIEFMLWICIWFWLFLNKQKFHLFSLWDLLNIHGYSTY